MKTLLALSVALTTSASTLACGDYASFQNLLDCSGQVRLTLDDLTREAVGTDKAQAEPAIRMLRARGPEGLRALLEANAESLRAHTTTTRLQPDESWLRVKSAIDGVSGQRDGYASQLYWYTDFEQAKAAAKAQAKPILSLRLLGKLDEEFSCANSRFFRTTLYANAEVSQYLRDDFILHWKSVRPVPRVTIDFGDGRKLERTITGNSIHYVLAADGSVIDALPGLYGPKAFLKGLNRAEELFQKTTVADVQQRVALLTQYHRARIAILSSELEADLQKLSATAASTSSRSIYQLVSLNSTAPATAQAAAKLTNPKRQAEVPVLEEAQRSQPNADASAQIDDATWSRIAALHQEDSRLDAPSRALLRAKNPTASEATRVAVSKTLVEDPVLRQIRNLERSISEDTCRNEYLLHSKIHAWLASGETANVDALNRKVYAELFLTPDSDPWLGLVPPDTFTALENNGVARVGGDHSKPQTTTAPGL